MFIFIISHNLIFSPFREENLAPEMDEFLNHTYSVFTKGLDRHLYIQEQELVVSKITHF